MYQYPNSWAIYLYVCPSDVASARWIGLAAGTALGLATEHPWLGWALGVAINYGIDRLTEPDGSIHMYFDPQSIIDGFGWVYNWGRIQDWLDGFAGEAWGWAQQLSNGNWWRLWW